MKVEIFQDAAWAGRAAAAFLATECRAAVDARGRFVVALSGGTTPGLLLRALARESIPWDAVHVLQADERVASPRTADRNLTHLQETLIEHGPLKPEQLHPMPVDDRDLEEAAQRYEQVIETIAGTPPVIDVAHLGLGGDGHTASLIPGDPVLDVTDADIAATNAYQGRRRLTMTYPILNRARRILWLVTGKEKTSALARLQAGDPSIPAGRVRRDGAVIFADRDAAGETHG
jgi:6-phosphogluconolactonase